ncbi:MAG: tRNA (adenosine(37)-N6)-threonylcarbamoyltransferase complex ATPase subunit type 1 TsaE [Alphaproteobacteria bacterium]|nr:tRNA (adenosine(37)-N6)-threonylcarbamoyltransferase complex ATPase subunit type 1 TsaE [Alphaproteobacteria bacterium]
MPDRLALPDLDATQRLAADIAPHLRQGDVIALSGDLGAGKTEFARALLKHLGVKGDVPSPTFTLLQIYDVSGLHVSHFDLYRLKSPNELDELGWDDALSDGVTLIEWPERAEGRLPRKRLTLVFEVDESGKRGVTVEPGPGWDNRLPGLLR